MQALGLAQSYQLFRTRTDATTEGSPVTVDLIEGDILFLLGCGRARGSGEVTIGLDVRADVDSDWAPITTVTSVDGAIATSLAIPAPNVSGQQLRATVTPATEGEVFDVSVNAIAHTKYPVSAPVLKGTADAIPAPAQATTISTVIIDTYTVTAGVGGGSSASIYLGGYKPIVGAIAVIAGYRATSGTPVASVVVKHSDDDGDSDPYSNAPVDGGGLNFEGQFPTVEPVTVPGDTIKDWMKIFYGGTGSGDIELFVHVVITGVA